MSLKLLKLFSILIGATFKGKNMHHIGNIFFPLIVASFKNGSSTLKYTLQFHSFLCDTMYKYQRAKGVFPFFAYELCNCTLRSHVLGTNAFTVDRVK